MDDKGLADLNLNPCDSKLEKVATELSEDSFKNLQNACLLGMDIGGSLIKIAYSSSYDVKTSAFTEDDSDFIYSVNEAKKKVSTINFIKFETKSINAVLDYMEKNLRSSKEFNRTINIKATGGGAYKYKDLINQKLGVALEKEDELKCLIYGCNFLLRNVPNEVFTIDYDNLKYEFKNVETNPFPYLLVQIGSGVSILKVESDLSFSRIGGSTIGGATLWGLGSLLTDAKGFEEILELAERGDHRNVDMLVKDIYGGNYDALGLNDELIASSLGKTTRSMHESFSNREAHLSKFKQEDLVKSILVMICYDLSQIASLHARIHNVKKIYFGGYFIHNSLLIMKFLKHGISYWTQNTIECLFMRHEGYLGAIGCFLKMSEQNLSEDLSKFTWYENLAHSSGIVRQRRESRKDSMTSTFDCFELNREEIKLVQCPLLETKNKEYIPDLIDLTKDEEARIYWLNCFENTINTYEKQCIKSCANVGNLGKKNLNIIENAIKKSAQEFKACYLQKLHELKQSPFAYGMLTVRSLLDLREHCMSQFGFFDVYSNEKREENQQGLELLSERCEYIEKLSCLDKKWNEILLGFLAGNVYDYGAQAFIQKQKSGLLDKFNQALSSVDEYFLSDQKNSEIIERFKKNFYKCICLFVDNSGFDIILGVLPLVIQLLKDPNTKVILCANSKAAINDITFIELLLVIKKACALNGTINEAFKSKRLFVIETGSASPCLDLSRINVELAELMQSNSVDLIILEGMGRSIHTNYDAVFKCDCLKAAVLKNEWLANRFGYKNEENVEKKKFPIIFKFEKFEKRIDDT